MPVLTVRVLVVRSVVPGDVPVIATVTLSTVFDVLMMLAPLVYRLSQTNWETGRSMMSTPTPSLSVKRLPDAAGDETGVTDLKLSEATGGSEMPVTFTVR